jgi:hypothetical protein
MEFGRFNLRIGSISRWFPRSFSLSWCLRCRTTWQFVEWHSTDYGHGRGCFPLCKKCWKDLGTPEARLPYYLTMFTQWRSTAHMVPDPGHLDELYEAWPSIRAAVLAGG